MRNILLASAALLTGTVSLAYAQAPANPMQGQLAAPYGSGGNTSNNNNAWGIANTPTGSAAAGPLEYHPSTEHLCGAKSGHPGDPFERPR